MHEISLAALNERIGRLEQRLRRWQRATLTGALLACAGLFLGAVAPPDQTVVVAERFVLKDPDGRIRAIMGDWPGGRLPDAAPGEPRYEAAVRPPLKASGFWGLHIFHKTGIYLASLKDFAGGSLTLNDIETASSMNMNVVPGQVGLRMEATRQSRAQYESERAEWQRKVVAAKTEEERLQASSVLTPAEREAQLVMTPDLARFSLEKKGKARLVLGQVGPRVPLSTIALFDSAGTVIQTLP